MTRVAMLFCRHNFVMFLSEPRENWLVTEPVLRINRNESLQGWFMGITCTYLLGLNTEHGYKDI